jgi:type IV secretory pathway VirB2 component (pilin)
MKRPTLTSPHHTQTSEAARLLLFCAVLVLAIGITNSYASAVGVSKAICTIPLSVINTSIGRGIATLGIIIIGIMATLGRITWTQAIVVGVGIAVIFGAASIAAMIAMNQGTDCST